MLRSACVGLAVVALCGCSSLFGSKPEDLVAAMAKDPAAISIHQQVTGPGWSIVNEVTRAASTNTAVSSSQSGAAIGIPAVSTAAVPIPAPIAPIAPTPGGISH